MEEKPHKKGLHIKVALITLVGILSPLLINIFYIPNAIYSIVVAILVALVSISILFILLKPLSSLLKGTESLGDGNLNLTLDIRSGDEFETLAESFNLMADKLKQSITLLEQEKDLLSSERNKLMVVLSSVVDGIIALDLARNVVLINKPAEEMTGYTLTELQGRPIDQFIHLFNDAEEIPPKTYCQASHLTKFLTLVGKDGKQVKINLLASPVTEGIQTNLGCILILHDLSKELELEQMKLDFVSMASHELKTPLTSIVGYLSVFISENRSKVEKEEMELLNRALVSSRQLLTLVENILSINKIEREQLSVVIEPIDYSNILTKAVEDLQNQAKLKNINLSLSLPQNLPKVLADPVRVSEVINNLVSNGINYTNPDGQVTVYVQVTPKEVITTVLDTGIGIPAVAIPHLFNKFFRVSSQLQKGSKGTGLGLYIAKSIVSKLNGKIWVESEVGKGSKFSFSLPLASKANLGTIDTSKFIGESIQAGGLNY